MVATTREGTEGESTEGERIEGVDPSAGAEARGGVEMGEEEGEEDKRDSSELTIAFATFSGKRTELDFLLIP